MIHRILYAAIAVGCSATAVTAEPLRMAQAEPMLLPAYEIVTIVRSAGFDPLSPAMRRGAFYVMRAAAPNGREMRVIVDGRRGRVVSASPVVAAAPGVAGPYERIDGPNPRAGYIPPGARDDDDDDMEPPAVYEGDRPLINEPRPRQAVPNVPPRNQSAAIPASPPPVTMGDEREPGMLPPPPERFPQRAAPGKPAAKPVPVARATAALPALPPLPKPRPAAAADEVAKSETPPASWPGAETAPAPQPAPDGKVDPRALPH